MLFDSFLWFTGINWRAEPLNHIFSLSSLFYVSLSLFSVSSGSSFYLSVALSLSALFLKFVLSHSPSSVATHREDVELPRHSIWPGHPRQTLLIIVGSTTPTSKTEPYKRFVLSSLSLTCSLQNRVLRGQYSSTLFSLESFKGSGVAWQTVLLKSYSCEVEGKAGSEFRRKGGEEWRYNWHCQTVCPCHSSTNGRLAVTERCSPSLALKDEKFGEESVGGQRLETAWRLLSWENSCGESHWCCVCVCVWSVQERQ